MPRGRKPLNLTNRTCKRCGLLCPIEMFAINRCASRPNGSIKTLCTDCNRKYSREMKRKYYEDPVKRARILERNRGYIRHKMPSSVLTHREHRSSKHMWIRIKCEAHELLDVDRVVVYLGPMRPYAKPVSDRPWVGRTWAIRQDRPGLVPPAQSIPLFRVSSGVTMVHPSCPQDWHWVAKMVQQWINRTRRKEQGNGDQGTA